VEEYLSEKEQFERLTGWLRSNGPWIIAGLAAGGLIVGGYRLWQARTDRQEQDASARYQQILDAFDRGEGPKGLGLVTALDHDHPGSPYADQANLAAARLLVQQGDLTRASSYLQSVVDGSHDAQLATVARLRLARVQVARDLPEAALATLGTANQGAFEAGFAEVRGDAWLAKGDRAAALREYRAARAAAGAAAAGPSEAGNDLLERKINDLLPAGSAPTSAPTLSTSAPTGSR